MIDTDKDTERIVLRISTPFEVKALAASVRSYFLVSVAKTSNRGNDCN